MSLINRLFPEIRSAFQRSHHPYRPIGALPALFDDPFFRDPWGAVSPFLQHAINRQPAVDVHETDKEYEIVAELPGVKKENIILEIINDDTVVLSGQFEQEVKALSSDAGETGGSGLEAPTSEVITGDNRGRGGVVLANERMLGAFRRVFQFPQRIDGSKISANLKDGILKVHVEKEEAKSAKIEVKEER